MRKETFGVARFVLSVMEIMGWCIAVIGAIALAIAIVRFEPMMVLAVSAGVLLAGLFAVAVPQIGRAQVVTAECLQELVALRQAEAEAARREGVRLTRQD